MTPEQRRAIIEGALGKAIRQKAGKIPDHIMNPHAPAPPTHFNCRSPGPSMYNQQVGRALRTPAGDANTVVSWDAISNLIGADTVQRIKEPS